MAFGESHPPRIGTFTRFSRKSTIYAHGWHQWHPLRRTHRSPHSHNAPSRPQERRLQNKELDTSTLYTMVCRTARNHFYRWSNCRIDCPHYIRKYVSYSNAASTVIKLPVVS